MPQTRMVHSMILIGSRSLAIRAPHILRREPLDFDYICTKQELDVWVDGNVPDQVFPIKAYSEGNKQIIESDDANFEFEIVQPGESSEMIYDLVKSDKDTLTTPFGLVPNLDMLFTIKQSHRYLKNSPAVWKTLIDNIVDGQFWQNGLYSCSSTEVPWICGSNMACNDPGCHISMSCDAFNGSGFVVHCPTQDQ